MSQLALYRKYRPGDFDELYGQNHIAQTLKNSVKGGNFSHAYLLCGPRGTGKTSVARILAKAINCEHNKEGNPDNSCPSCKMINESKAIDIIEIDAASHTQVDNIREIIVERASFAPNNLKYKVYIIDEAHMLSKSSFNALLKTLEEPPAHAIFILATTEPNKIIPTIISRCQRFDFKRINIEDLVKRLTFIAKEEKLTVEDGVLESIAVASEGGFRDAISLLDQVSKNNNKIDKKLINSIIGTGDFAAIEEFVFAVLRKETSRALEIVNSQIEDGYNIDNFFKNSIDLMRKILLSSVVGVKELGFFEELAKKVEALLNATETGEILRAIDTFIETEKKYRYSSVPQLGIEVAAIKATSNFIKAPIEATREPKPKEDKKQVVEEKKAETVVSTKAVNPKGNALKWQELLMEVKKNNNSIHAFLRVCEADFSDDQVKLSFPYKFHKERIEDAKNRRVVEDAFQRVYGKTYKVKCLLKPLTSVEAVSAPRKDDLLEDALEIFGGEVID